MPRRGPIQPVLPDLSIERLIAMPKPITDVGWLDLLLGGDTDHYGNTSGRLDLPDVTTGPWRGQMLIYARSARAATPGDWSTGLVFRSLAGHSYPLLRCNGPHPSVHTNTLDGDDIVTTPHIHYLTERYQQAGRVESGYAEATDSYTTLRGAIGTLQRMANLVGDGILLYGVTDG